MSNNTTTTTGHFEGYEEFKRMIYRWMCLFVFAGFAGVVMNTMTVIVFIFNKTLHRRSFYCLVNLALADMMYSIARSVHYFNIFSWPVGRKMDVVIYEIFSDFFGYSFYTAVFSLLLVSLDRVFATFFPFRHLTLNIGCYFVAFAFGWLCPVFYYVIPSLYFYTSFTRAERLAYNWFSRTFNLALIILNFFCYISIFVKVKLHGRFQQEQSSIQIRQRREQHLVVTLFIVTMLSLVTLLPFSVSLLFSVRFKSREPHYFIAWLQLFNSIVNPVLYVFRIKEFRKAIVNLFSKCKCHKYQIHPASTITTGSRNKSGMDG